LLILAVFLRFAQVRGLADQRWLQDCSCSTSDTQFPYIGTQYPKHGTKYFLLLYLRTEQKDPRSSFST